MTKIQELVGIEQLPHQAYSPDLAHSEYHLFRSLAHFLRGRNFENLEAVEVELSEFFASKTRDCYHLETTNLAERCLNTIEYNVSTLKSSAISSQKTFQIKFGLKNYSTYCIRQYPYIKRGTYLLRIVSNSVPLLVLQMRLFNRVSLYRVRHSSAECSL